MTLLFLGCSLLSKSSRYMCEKEQISYLSSIDIIQHEVELVFRLEWVVEIDEEGMLEVHLEHVSLCHYVFYLENLSHFTLKCSGANHAQFSTSFL